MKKYFFSLLFLLISNSNVFADNTLLDYFFSAARTGNTEVLSEFLNNGFPVDQRNPQSYTALMMATYYGHKDAVKVLLEKGANVCLKDKRGHTAMMGAIVKAEWSIAKKLYETDCEKAYSSGKTLKQFASIFGQTDKLNELTAEQ